MDEVLQAQELWRHPDPKSTQMYAFKQHISQKYAIDLPDYDALYQWSISNVAAFWEEIWKRTGIKAHTPYKTVFDASSPMFPKPSFFSGSTLNFAENMLFPACDPDPSSPAVIAANETSRETVTWAELRERVEACAAAMRSVGLQKDDRVAGYLANHTNTLVAMLAATSIGAIWTGVSPDTGVHAVLDRLKQIEPVMLFADNAVEYNQRVHETHDKILEVVKELPGLKDLVIFPTVPGHAFDLSSCSLPNGTAQTYTSFLSSARATPLVFEYLPPDHPIYILYSSGTTGAPKGIVHGALGTLLQHKKEHTLHCDIRPGERLFYYTTCTWMMWHWLVSGLASGATLIIYDGSPFKPYGEMSMPCLIDELEINHFGTSAKYLSVLEQSGLHPSDPSTFTPSDPKGASSKPVTKPINLKTLKAVYSTGSPLAPSTFHYIYSAFPPLMLGSITGGTDILSLFAACNPLLPVHVGEIQCRTLGLAIAAFDPNGNDISATGAPGDLVCTVPFPCQPVMFWPPGPTGAEKYRKSYFETYGERVWHHGDFVRFNPSTGGVTMLGRSDGVLKPAGVRFGSSEIYNIILKHFSTEVEDSLCVGRRRENDLDETVVLFVKMAPDQHFSTELGKKIQDAVKTALTVRHVPKVVDECPDIPVTSNGKKVENAVKQILCGINIKTSASVANKECLDFYRDWAGRN